MAPTRTRCKDTAYAARVYGKLVRRLLSAGTTTAVYYLWLGLGLGLGLGLTLTLTLTLTRHDDGRLLRQHPPRGDQGLGRRVPHVWPAGPGGQGAMDQP